jgi:hypothetical protein
MKAEYAGCAYPKKKKKSVLASLPRLSIGEKRMLDSKTKQGRLRGRQVLDKFCPLSRLRFEISRLRLRFLAG